jgi:hypothetical protein
MTSKQYSVVVTSVLAAVISAAGTNARAQCPTTLPQSVINSIQLPEARAAAQSTRLDAAMISQNGGLPNMIRLAQAQLEADQATVAEERRNQTYLTQNGMGNDKRAIDGRKVIQMLEDSQRATAAFTEIMECHNRMSGAPSGQSGSALPGASEDRIVPGVIPAAEMLPGPARTPSSIVPGSRPAGAPAAASSQNGFVSGGSLSPSTTNAWAMSPGDRQAALSHEVRKFRPEPQGVDAKTALDSLSRSMREKAMANASPEVAAFWAKQDALRANGDANTAAAMAGQARGLADAKNGSLDAQMKMVNDAVRGWQVPRGYSATAAINAGTIVDPFAASAPIDFKKAVELALGSTGLAWNRTRQIAQVAAAQGGACGGRLQVGDYPVLPDGNLLDTPERIAQFLETCATSSPVLVVRESGEVEVRK